MFAYAAIAPVAFENELALALRRDTRTKNVFANLRWGPAYPFRRLSQRAALANMLALLTDAAFSRLVTFERKLGHKIDIAPLARR